MPERRPARTDWGGWSLFAIGLIVATCLFSNEAEGDGNFLGPPGAWLADLLTQALGAAVHVLLIGWFVLVVLLLIHQPWRVWALRLFGWLLVLPVGAVAADWLGPAWLGGPLPGSGGTLGAWLRSWLEADFSPLGAITFFSIATVTGLMLAADFVVAFLLRMLGAGLRISFQTAVKTARAWSRWREARRQRRWQSAIPIHRPQEQPLPSVDSTNDEGPAPRILPIVRRPELPPEEVHDYAAYELPPLTLLEDPEPFPFEAHDQKLREQGALLEQTFKDFELNVRVVGINTGPVVTQYEIALETGMRVNKVTGLGDDLALHLRVPSVRIVAPIPGKNTVGIEVPNEHRATVRLKEVILGAGKKGAKAKIPLFLGKDTEGRPLVYDLADMPHLLIAGTTGTGKSVCMNSIILSVLMTRRPDEIKMIMIDPKRTELTDYSKLPHLMHPVVNDMKKAEAILAWAVDKMEERYDILSRARVRHISAYNELGIDEIKRRLQPDEDEAQRIPEKMPYIVIFVDELGDLMMLLKREVETHIIRLAQKSRAAGIHLVLATQKPTVDVITGLIKSNLPGRICFKVSSRMDSRVVLDEMGADKLLGKGDMLFLQPGTSDLLRSQGTYASDREISNVIGHLECEKPCYAAELVQLKISSDSGGHDKFKERDELYEQAIEIIVREGRGSVSLLQRALGIGYGRAARLVDFMAEDGIVGAYKGSNAREVLFTPEEWQEMKHGRVAARA